MTLVGRHCTLIPGDEFDVNEELASKVLEVASDPYFDEDGIMVVDIKGIEHPCPLCALRVEVDGSEIVEAPITYEQLWHAQKYERYLDAFQEIYGESDDALDVVFDFILKYNMFGETAKDQYMMRVLTNEDAVAWEAYKKIGTVPECLEAMLNQEGMTDARDKIIEDIDMLQKEYEEIHKTVASVDVKESTNTLLVSFVEKHPVSMAAAEMIARNKVTVHQIVQLLMK